MSDHYETLNVPRDATPEQIKKSFRELALKYHPDRNPDNPQAEEQFKKINEAYSVLGDPEKKARYDSGVPEGYPAYETAGAGQGYNPYGPYGPFAQDDGEESQGGWTFYGPFGFGTWKRPEPREPTRQEAREWLIRSILTVVAGVLLFRVSLIFGIFGLIICVMAISRGFMNTIRAIKLLHRLRKQG
jgi:molecular chaperone DnaJ